MKADELDKIFDSGKEDILPYLDMSKAKRTGLEIKRINVDLPSWMIDRLDEESKVLGTTRQAALKFLLAKSFGWQPQQIS
jgi:hypothetical protein